MVDENEIEEEKLWKEWLNGNMTLVSGHLDHDSSHMTRLFRWEMILPSTEPVDAPFPIELSVRPCRSGVEGYTSPWSRVRCTAVPVVPIPDEGRYTRSWLPPEGDSMLKESETKMRLLQFNILGKSLAYGNDGTEELPPPTNPGNYSLFEPDEIGVVYHFKQDPGVKKNMCGDAFSCHADHLEWPYRRTRVLEEIVRHDPDIISLQEVDREPWEYLSRELETRGYRGIHGSKNFDKGKAGYRSGKEEVEEGCAIFWESGAFEQVGEPYVCRLGDENTTHIALLVRLRSLKGGQISVHCTTHLKAGITPYREAQRVEQSAALLRGIHEFGLKGGYTGEACIVSGDLNAHHNEMEYGGECIPGDTIQFFLDQGFLDAYQTTNRNAHALWTFWAGRPGYEIRACFDYIFFKGSGMRALRTLSIPEFEEVVSCETLIPNIGFPSDHIPVVVDIALDAPPSLTESALTQPLCGGAILLSIALFGSWLALSSSRWFANKR